MSVTIHCPHCGATGNAPDHILGQSVRCSKCKKQFLAGGEADESDEAPEEPADDYDDMDDAPPPPRRRGGRSRSGGGGGGNGGSPFMEFAAFRTLVAPRFIVILYWVLVILYALVGLLVIVGSLFSGQVFAILGAVIGVPIAVIVGSVFLRLGMEAMIVQFRIYEVLKEINTKTK